MSNFYCNCVQSMEEGPKKEKAEEIGGYRMTYTKVEVEENSIGLFTGICIHCGYYALYSLVDLEERSKAFTADERVVPKRMTKFYKRWYNKARNTGLEHPADFARTVVFGDITEKEASKVIEEFKRSKQGL